MSNVERIAIDGRVTISHPDLVRLLNHPKCNAFSRERDFNRNISALCVTFRVLSYLRRHGRIRSWRNARRYF